MSSQETVIVHRVCPLCGQDNGVSVPTDVMERYRAGDNVQDAWPDGTPGDREVLISGAHERCYDAAFETEEDWL